MTRENISKKLRFEVFKRDSFTCQYCGQKAPDIVLNCDHIKPVADGGTTDILNLITSCFSCNSGKSDRSLSDHAALDKQRDQLAELQERRDQIEMMIEWRDQLSRLNSDVADRIEERWKAIIEGQAHLNPSGKDTLRKHISKFGVDLVLRAMEASATSYLKRDDDQVFTIDSINHAWNQIGAVCRVLKQSETRPWLQKLYYIRGILRRRLHYMNRWQAMKLMENALLIGGADIERIEEVAKEVRNWSQFRQIMEAWAVPDEEEGDGADS